MTTLLFLLLDGLIVISIVIAYIIFFEYVTQIVLGISYPDAKSITRKSLWHIMRIEKVEPGIYQKQLCNSYSELLAARCITY